MAGWSDLEKEREERKKQRRKGTTNKGKKYMNLDIPWYSFSATFLQILSTFMFMQDKENEEQKIGYKE